MLVLSSESDPGSVFLFGWLFFSHKTSHPYGIGAKGCDALSSGLVIQGQHFPGRPDFPPTLLHLSKPETSWKPLALVVLPVCFVYSQMA